MDIQKSILDIQKSSWILDIHNSIYGYRIKIRYMDIQKSIFGYSKIILDIHNYFIISQTI